MSTSTSPRLRPSILLIVAVCLVAANMRMTITGVGPLLETMADDLGTSTSALSALTSLPLVAWALISPATHALSQRFGLDRLVLISLIALMTGTLVRSLGGPTLNLWLGTIIIGAGLAIANVLMPAQIRRDFPDRVPAMMAVYTSLLSGCGALSSGLVVPIALMQVGETELGWRVALLASGAALPIAAVAWGAVMLRTRRRDRAAALDEDALDAPTPEAAHRVWRDSTAWLVAAYMGLQSIAFYIQLTWTASFATSHGMSAVEGGFVVMVFQLVSIAGPLALPLLLRTRIRRWTPALPPTVAALAVLGMMFVPQLLWVWAPINGIGAGALLGMSLTLMAERAPNHATASALSGMAQTVGYTVAAAGPVLFGAIHAATGEWVMPFLVVLGVLVAGIVVGLIVGDGRMVGDGRRRKA